jgi:uncharacterized membrane protein YiaA
MCFNGTLQREKISNQPSEAVFLKLQGQVAAGIVPVCEAYAHRFWVVCIVVIGLLTVAEWNIRLKLLLP